MGEHDFASFCSASSSASTTVRTIYELTVEKEGDELVIRICGSGFLYGEDNCGNTHGGGKRAKAAGGDGGYTCGEKPMRGRVYGAGVRADVGWV